VSLCVDGRVTTYRNIAIAFGLHPGWNLVKFSGDYYYTDMSTRMTEAEAFNLIEGSLFVLAMAALLAFLSEVIAMRSKIVITS